MNTTVATNETDAQRGARAMPPPPRRLEKLRPVLSTAVSRPSRKKPPKTSRAAIRHGQLLFVLLWAAGALPLGPADPITDHAPDAANSGCKKCHAGIELIREPGSEMLRQIMEGGRTRGNPAGRVVCHGGDPSITDDKEYAHGGDFYPAPASSPTPPASTTAWSTKSCSRAVGAKSRELPCSCSRR